jgi:mannose-6-phosphate isomerase-like protein (cupin superfamily)
MSVEQLQALMRDMPQLRLETRHYWCDGMYCRELFRPAGTLIVGKIHKREHFYMVLKGDVTVVTDDVRRDVTGPAILISPPGTKRAVLARTDATCVTVHRTELTDLAEIERELIEPDDTALYGPGNELLALPL